MKKVIAFILAVILSACLVACGTNIKYSIDDYTWTMTSIQSVEQNGDFIAYAPYDDSFDINIYPDAVAIEMICNAKDGALLIIDKTNNQTYNGTYKITNNSKKTTIYGIAIGEKSGTAVVSLTYYQNGTKISTMVLSIGDYALNFQAN